MQILYTGRNNNKIYKGKCLAKKKLQYPLLLLLEWPVTTRSLRVSLMVVTQQSFFPAWVNLPQVVHISSPSCCCFNIMLTCCYCLSPLLYWNNHHIHLTKIVGGLGTLSPWTRSNFFIRIFSCDFPLTPFKSFSYSPFQLKEGDKSSVILHLRWG